MTDASWPLSEGEDAFLLHVTETTITGNLPRKIGVAVSGGSDSMALLHICVRVQAHHGGSVHAVTVDHRLRAEAAEEARFVGQFCHRLGVAHDTLVWDHGKISGNLQDQARRARYHLISDWARERGIRHVVLGHTADDQAETFLMGLARAAGIDGLSGMRRQWDDGVVRWARPLLLTPRAALRDYLVRNGVSWVEDPSNADERYTRVKARRVLKALRPLGITVDKLADVTVNLAIAQGALREAAAKAAEEVLRTDAGEVVIDRAGLGQLGPELTRRILIAALRWVSSAPYAPRAAQVMRLVHAIQLGRHATLWGCRSRVGDTEIRIAREPKAVAEVETPTDMIWDGRWRLSGPHRSGLRVRALGADGLRQCGNWRETGHSRAALLVSPAIWRDESLISAPLAGFGAGWTAEIAAGFPSFMLSH